MGGERARTMPEQYFPEVKVLRRAHAAALPPYTPIREPTLPPVYAYKNAPFLCPTRGRLFLAWRGVEVSMEYEQTTQYESAVGWSSQPRITTISTTACSTDRPPLQLSVVIFTMKIHLSTKPADNRHCSLFRHHQTSVVFSFPPTTLVLPRRVGIDAAPRQAPGLPGNPRCFCDFVT